MKHSDYKEERGCEGQLGRNRERLRKVFGAHAWGGRISRQEFLKLCHRCAVIPHLATIKQVKALCNNYASARKLLPRYEAEPILSFDHFEDLIQEIASFSFKGSDDKRIEKFLSSIKEAVQKNYKQILTVKDTVSDQESETEEEHPIYLLACAAEKTATLKKAKNFSPQKDVPADDVVDSNIDLALKVLNSPYKSTQPQESVHNFQASPKVHKEPEKDKRHSQSTERHTAHRKKPTLDRARSGTRLSFANAGAIFPNVHVPNKPEIDDDLKEFLELESSVKCSSKTQVKFALTCRDCVASSEDSSPVKCSGRKREGRKEEGRRKKGSKSRTRYDREPEEKHGSPNISIIKVTPVKKEVKSGKSSIALTKNTSIELLRQSADVAHSSLRMPRDNELHKEDSIEFASEHEHTRSSFKSSMQMLNFKDSPKKRNKVNGLESAMKFTELLKKRKPKLLKVLNEIMKRGAFAKWKKLIAKPQKEKHLSGRRKPVYFNTWKSVVLQNKLKRKIGLRIINSTIKNRLKSYLVLINNYRNKHTLIKFGILLATLMLKGQNVLNRTKERSLRHLLDTVNRKDVDGESGEYYMELQRMKERFSKTKDIINNWSKIVTIHKID